MPNPSDIKYEVVEYTRGAVLEIGNGGNRTYPHFLTVATDGKPLVKVDDLADLSGAINPDSVDSVFYVGDSINASLVKHWWSFLKADGYLVLYFDKQPGFEAKDVVDLVRGVDSGYDLIVRQDREGDAFLLVFKKLATSKVVNSWMMKSFSGSKKTACVVRYGGFGDMIQSANLFPALKREGYRVTVMTTPKGYDILKNDPHIDEWFIQDHDQVPNHELGDFWKVVSKRYDKFVNLCESVEGTLIAMPGRASHAWPHEVRHAMLNKNYLEFTSQLAGVEYASESKFYPTADELAAAKARLCDGLNVVWALAGSSCHKFYPGQDTVMARILLEHPNCRIFMVGDEACQILEAGWEKEERVVCLSGKINIRDTLTLAKVADVVIGCETGVLNAVAFEDNRKVVLLSHSSHENLTKHWKNSIALAPEGLSCYPCHRLHYTREFCNEDKETGAAMCQKLIPPSDVYAAVEYKEEVAA